MKTYDMTGEVTLVQQRHGPCQTLSESEQLALLQLCLDDPGIFLKEIQQELQHACGKCVSLATICRTVKQLGLSRRKLHFRDQTF